MSHMDQICPGPIYVLPNMSRPIYVPGPNMSQAKYVPYHLCPGPIYVPAQLCPGPIYVPDPIMSRPKYVPIYNEGIQSQICPDPNMSLHIICLLEPNMSLTQICPNI